MFVVVVVVGCMPVAIMAVVQMAVMLGGFVAASGAVVVFVLMLNRRVVGTRIIGIDW